MSDIEFFIRPRNGTTQTGVPHFFRGGQIYIGQDPYEELEHLVLASDDLNAIRDVVKKYNLDINDEEVLKTVCLRNNEKIFNLFMDEFKANFTIDDYSILKYYAFSGDVKKLNFLLKRCNVNFHQFLNSCKSSTIFNSKDTAKYIAKEKMIREWHERMPFLL